MERQAFPAVANNSAYDPTALFQAPPSRRRLSLGDRGGTIQTDGTSRDPEEEVDDFEVGVDSSRVK
jgi:hypothetical protein